jgi:hypothetical protein
MNVILTPNHGLRRPYGASRRFRLSFPTLKRGANRHCASAAFENLNSFGQQNGFMRLPGGQRRLSTEAGAPDTLFFGVSSAYFAVRQRRAPGLEDNCLREYRPPQASPDCVGGQ